MGEPAGVISSGSPNVAYRSHSHRFDRATVIFPVYSKSVSIVALRERRERTTSLWGR